MFTDFFSFFLKQKKKNCNDKTGEWWNRDINSVLRQAIFTGAAPNISDAYTINGQPGDLYPCSSQGFSLSKSHELLIMVVRQCSFGKKELT